MSWTWTVWRVVARLIWEHWDEHSVMMLIDYVARERDMGRWKVPHAMELVPFPLMIQIAEELKWSHPPRPFPLPYTGVKYSS